MLKNIPTDIKEAQAAIQAEKKSIAIHQQKISGLSFFITERLKEETDKKLNLLEKNLPQSRNAATQEFLNSIQHNPGTFFKLRSLLSREINQFTFGSKIFNKLKEKHCYYMWQVAQYPCEYWKEALSPRETFDIEQALTSMGITMGLDYVYIMLNIVSDE